MKKQCVVFIDDLKAVNELQMKHLKKFVKNNAPEYPTPVSHNGGLKYAFADGLREITVLSNVVSLETDGNDNAREHNKELINKLLDNLFQLKEEYDTVLPIVDLCLSGSKGLDPAWNMKDVQSLFESLYSFRIKLLVSCIFNAIAPPYRKDFESQDILFVPRPIVQTDPEHPYFDEDSNSMSTCEASFFADKLLADNWANEHVNRELFRKLVNTKKGYDRYFYTILMANDILFNFK